MKRKRAIAAFAAGACALVLLTGCSLFPYSNEADGNFPYDAAVQGGYDGTESEWLSAQESEGTVYRKMYEEALSDGSFEGTYFEFLQAISAGADETPYMQRALLSSVSVVAFFSSGDTETGSAGSGTIIRLDKSAGDAFILTNYHVVYSSSSKRVYDDIGVYLYGGKVAARKINATFYGGVMEDDIALLKVEGDSLLKESDAQAAPLGDSEGVLAGEPVYAVGNPNNEDISVTRGVVSVVTEYCRLNATDGNGYMRLPEIRIDAAVNEGNSGGGLFNGAGELIGVVNARRPNGDIVGFGYAIPVNFALAVARNILDGNGTAKVARLNVTASIEDSKSVYDETRGIAHIEQKIVVTEYFGGAGSAAGIRTGDTLCSGAIVRGGVRMEEVFFTHYIKLQIFLLGIRTGDTLILNVSRLGTVQELRVSFTLSTYFLSYSPSAL